MRLQRQTSYSLTVALINYPNKEQNFNALYYLFFSGLKLSFADISLLFSGKIPAHVAARLTRKYWVPNFRHFVTIPPPLHPYLQLFVLFVTIRHYSPLFVPFAIRDYSLFAIRVFQTPLFCLLFGNCFHTTTTLYMWNGIYFPPFVVQIVLVMQSVIHVEGPISARLVILR